MWIFSAIALVAWSVLSYCPGMWQILIPLGIGLAALPFTMLNDWLLPSRLVAALIIAVVWLVVRRRWRPPHLPGYAWDVLALTAVLLFGFNLALPYDRYHHNFFIGPANDVLNGRTMFVDGINQYGMLITYVLAAVFSTDALPLSYHGFSFLIGVLILLQFGVLYALLRLTTHNRALSTAGMLIMSLLYVARLYIDPYTHPSSGPIRYGALFLLVLLVALRLDRERPRLVILEIALTTYTAIWSLETGIFTWALYAALVVVEMIATAPNLITGIRKASIRLGAMVLCGALAFGAFNVFTYWRSGSWPDWTTYLEFFTVYNGIGWLVDLWSPWLPVMALSYMGLAGVLWVLLTGESATLQNYVAPFGIALIGIMQIYYWVRVPFTGSIGAYVLPATYIALYAVHVVGQLNRPKLRMVTHGVALTAGVAIVVRAATTPPPPTPIHTPAQELTSAFRQGRAPSLGFSRLTNTPTTYLEYELAESIDTRLWDTVHLIDTYAPEVDSIQLLINMETATDALIRKGISHRYPTSHLPIEEEFNPLRLEQIRTYVPDYQPGEVILVQTDLRGLSTVQLEQWAQIQADYTLEWLEVTPSGVAAARLHPLGEVVDISTQTTTADTPEIAPTVQPFDGVEMVQVAPGCFMMGSDDGYASEQPTHEVCMDAPYWIDRYAVSNAQFEQHGGTAEGHSPSDAPDAPRTNIMWIEAVRYCEARGGRLPTEAEWEYAARGAESLTYPWGNMFDGELVNSCDANCEQGWHTTAYDDGYAELAPVDAYTDGASWAGAVGMVGNTWEWTSSRYDPDLFPYPYNTEDGREDMNGNGVARVVRGGAWDTPANLLRASTRTAHYATYDVRPTVGFSVRERYGISAKGKRTRNEARPGGLWIIRRCFPCTTQPSGESPLGNPRQAQSQATPLHVQCSRRCA